MVCLRFSYPGSAELTVRGLSFAIDKGEMLGFLRPGGTTFMFGASMLLLEKSQGTLQALQVSPLTSTEYPGSKAAALTTFVYVAPKIRTMRPDPGSVMSDRICPCGGSP